jgi:transcription initiation factor IIE alpha subunit
VEKENRMAKEVKYSETGQSLLIKALGYSPKLRIIDIFLTNSFFDFSKEELAKELGMSKQTLYKNFYDLEELGIVTISRKIGRATLYKINEHHPLIKSLNDIITEMSLQIGKREAEKRVTSQNPTEQTPAYL